MTELSPNDVFRASSFLHGASAAYLERLQARFARDPEAVDEDWRAFFRQMGADEAAAEAGASGPSWARADWPPVPDGEITAALTGEWPAGPPAKEARAAGEKIAAKAKEAGAGASPKRSCAAPSPIPSAP